jgi:predicted Zn-dependent protease
LDYSLYTPAQRALKNTYAGTDWKSGEYKNQIQFAREQLKILEKSPKQIPRGPHRCYLAPAAVSEIIQMLSWGCMSEASIRQGESPLMKVRSGEKSFSPLFSLHEDFRVSETPRFNSEGEVSPEFLALIKKGDLSHTLISSRTAKEYEIQSNFACESETLRAPSVATGSLHESEILQKLGTGLYLSNLHYLNWSDQPGGRITGMTRYACFWVEKGVITAPIENLRFDDSIFNILGGALEMLTQSRSYLPEVGTYEGRSTGGMNLPGLLLSEMNFTL